MRLFSLCKVCSIVVFASNYCVWARWWIPKYDGNKRISQLNIAGTHDSMSWTTGIRPARCQDWSLKDQLTSGIRFIDIRARHFDGGLPIHHEQVYLDANFGGVLNTVVQYLNENPSEAILMSVKEEYKAENNGDESFEAAVKKVLEQNKDKWWNGQENNPTLNEIRGKFVIIQRFGGERLGIPWADFNIQDEYDKKPDDKNGAIDRQIDNALGGDQNTKYINFISANSIKDFGTLFSRDAYSPKETADKCNPHLKQKLESVGDVKHKRLGIIVMDFPPNDIIEMLNDGASGGDNPPSPDIPASQVLIGDAQPGK